MNKLQFDFLANKEKHTLTIKREFAAERQLVWDCYTKQELLDQWFAPKPLTIRTKSMDFRNGGHWHFAMIDPDGNQFWSLMNYDSITPIDYYDALDAFSNEQGEINESLPRANWRVTFSDKEENTVVETVVRYASLNDLEAVINMGLKEGMTSTMERLDGLLQTLKQG